MSDWVKVLDDGRHGFFLKRGDGSVAMRVSIYGEIRDLQGWTLFEFTDDEARLLATELFIMTEGESNEADR